MREDFDIDNRAHIDDWESVKTFASKYKNFPKNEVLKQKYAATLCLAIAKGKVEVLSDLLAAGTPQYSIQQCGRGHNLFKYYDPLFTPIHLAAATNNSKIFELLAKNGANLSLTDSTAKTPIEWMAIVSSSPGDWEFIKYLIKQYPPTVGFFQTDIYHYSQILNLAVIARQYEIVETLLDAGVSQIADLETGNTPLHFAMINNDKEIVQLLMAYKANTQAKNKAGEIPLQLMGYEVAMAIYDEAKISKFQDHSERVCTQKDIQCFESSIVKMLAKVCKQKSTVELRERCFTLGRIYLFKSKSDDRKVAKPDFINAIIFLILSGNKTKDGIWYKERCYMNLNNNIPRKKPEDPLPLEKSLVLELINIFSAYPQDEMKNEIGELYENIGEFDKACEIWKSISKTSPDAVKNIILLMERNKVSEQKKALLKPVIAMGYYFGILENIGNENNTNEQNKIYAIQQLRKYCNDPLTSPLAFEYLQEISLSKNIAVSTSAKDAIGDSYFFVGSIATNQQDKDKNLSESARWAFGTEHNGLLSEKEQELFHYSAMRKYLEISKIIQIIKNNQHNETFINNTLLLSLIYEECENLKTCEIALMVLQDSRLYTRLDPVELLKLYCDDDIRARLPEVNKNQLLCYFGENCPDTFVQSKVFINLQATIKNFETAQKVAFLENIAQSVLLKTSTRNNGFKQLFYILGYENLVSIANYITDNMLSHHIQNTPNHIFKISYLCMFLNINTKTDETMPYSPFESFFYNIDILSDLYDSVDFIDDVQEEVPNSKIFWKDFLRQKALALIKETIQALSEMERRAYLEKNQKLPIFKDYITNIKKPRVIAFVTDLFVKTDAVSEIQNLSLFSSSRFSELSLAELCKIVNDILKKDAEALMTFPNESSKKLIRQLITDWGSHNKNKDQLNDQQRADLKESILNNISVYMDDYKNNHKERVFEIIKEAVREFLYVEEFKASNKIFKAIENNNMPFLIDFLNSLTGKHDPRLNQFDQEGLRLIDHAILFNRLEMVQLLIKYRAEFNTYNENGTTPLHYAVWNCNIEITKLLIHKGAFINAKDSKRKTPLHYAAENDDIKLYQYLISKGADSDAKDDEGKNPRDYLSDESKAALEVENNTDVELHATKQNIIQLLSIFSSERFFNLSIDDLRKIVDEILTKDDGASRASPNEASKQLIINLKENCQKYQNYNEHKDRVNNQLYRQQCAEIKTTILQTIRIYMGDYNNNHNERLFKIIEKTFKDFFSIETLKENSKVIEAVKKGDIKFLTDFLNLLSGKYDSRLHQLDQEGLRLIDHAVISGNLEVVKLFMSHGAEFSLYNKQGYSLLHYAVINDNIEITKFLIEKGEYINARDSNRKTPLHLAAEKGAIEICKYLISKEADINAKDKEAKKPRDCLSEENKKALGLEKDNDIELQQWKEQVRRAITGMQSFGLTPAPTNLGPISTAQIAFVTSSTTTNTHTTSSGSNFNSGSQ